MQLPPRPLEPTAMLFRSPSSRRERPENRGSKAPGQQHWMGSVRSKNQHQFNQPRREPFWKRILEPWLSSDDG